MLSNGAQRAQKFIKQLRSLTAEQHDDYLNKCVLGEIESFIRLAQQVGLEVPFTLPMTRKAFDIIYVKMESQGIIDPEAFIKEEADYIKELKNNPDSIGIEFMAEVKSARVKMAPHIASRLNVSNTQCEAILHQFMTMKNEPDTNLTADENAYIEAYRLIIKQGLEKGNYASNAYEAPKTSPWAERIRAQDHKNKLDQHLQQQNRFN